MSAVLTYQSRFGEWSFPGGPRQVVALFDTTGSSDPFADADGEYFLVIRGDGGTRKFYVANGPTFGLPYLSPGTYLVQLAYNFVDEDSYELTILEEDFPAEMDEPPADWYAKSIGRVEADALQGDEVGAEGLPTAGIRTRKAPPATPDLTATVRVSVTGRHDRVRNPTRPTSVPRLRVARIAWIASAGFRAPRPRSHGGSPAQRREPGGKTSSMWVPSQWAHGR